MMPSVLCILWGLMEVCRCAVITFIISRVEKNHKFFLDSSIDLLKVIEKVHEREQQMSNRCFNLEMQVDRLKQEIESMKGM